jgi:hypothetical protein
MKTVKGFIESCRVARKQVYQNLTIFPLLGGSIKKPGYLTLEQALEKGCLTVTEIDEGGSVPELLVVNTGTDPVMLVEGEELIGAKQNRVLNATFLLAGKSETVVPVSCVEQGRWSYQSDAFRSGEKMMHSSLRQATQNSVRYYKDCEGDFASDQGQVWDLIERKANDLNVSSRTSAASDVFESRKADLDVYADGFTLVDRQVCALFAIDGQLMGLEGFGCEDTFGRFFEKLVKSYALDAIDSKPGSTKNLSVAPAKAKAFLESVGKAQGTRHSAIGLGATVTFESRIASGMACVKKNSLLHLSAFRKQARGSESRERVRYRRFSQRRDF